MSDSDYTDDEEQFENEDDLFDYYDIDNNVYDPEEPSITRYNIILCELYNENIHGQSSKNVKTQYLVFSRFKTLHNNHINVLIEQMKEEYNYVYNVNHEFYRNYRNIIRRDDYIKPEIAHCIYLKTNECVAILKTFWIRLIQRTWKNVFKKRKDCIKKRCSINALKYREIYGKWPISCSKMPNLRGMLHNM
jgi:hypothetical protein